MKTTHKLKLTENEMEIVRLAVERMLNSITEAMNPWTDLDEEPPECLQERFAEISQLYNKLTDPF